MDAASNRISEYIRRGDAHYAVGRYAQALQEYGHGLVLDAYNVMLLAKKANTLLKMGDPGYASIIYQSSLFHAHALDLVDQFVEQEYGAIQEDVVRLFDLLTQKYLVPITLEGVTCLIHDLQEERTEKQRLSTWKKFERKLDKRQFTNLEDFVDLFLKEFGQQYEIHFGSFQCYLSKFRGQCLTIDQLLALIHSRITMKELEQFEHLLRRKVRKKGQTLDRMSGIEFEQYLSTFFASCGYQVTQTPASHDQGADLILTKFGESIVVQAKRQKRPVGTTSIQEVVTAQRVHRTEKARVITSSAFTKPAVTLAQQLGVELWDRKRLLLEIRSSRYSAF